MRKDSLANDIWRVCDILRRDNNCGGVMEYVEHLAWLLFLRFLDQQEENFALQAELDGRAYQPILKKNLRWRNWATKDWKADDLLTFVHGTLLPEVQNLSGSPVRETITGVFSDRNVIVCASPYNLKDVLEIINGIDFLSEDDIHTVSHVYESLLQRLGSENKVAGEFYTPRPVIRFLVQAMNPKIGETVYDPACGSCGFLAEAYVHMVRSERTTEDHETLQRRTFTGQEKKPVPALLGLMNMVLHGVLTPEVLRRNTLEENIRDVSRRFDVILTNPPFGGTENQQIQQNFPVKGQATELLFVQHVMKKLKVKDGARCGMVVPEGTLFRGGVFADVKKDLLESFSLYAVVSLPPGTFSPYSDVKTALLLFRRPGPTDTVWYYEMPLPEGLKKFSKGSPIQDDHFDEARKLLTQRRTGDHSWTITAADLAARGYDLTARNPNRPDDEAHRDPAKITASLLETEREILSILEEVHALVSSGETDNETPTVG